MVRFLLLLLLSLSVAAASGAKEEAARIGAETNFDTALAKAKAQKRMLVMVVVKEHCRWCEKLVNRTMADPEVQKVLKGDFITLIIDRYDSYPKVFREDFFPSIFYIDYATGQSVYENVGYVGKKCFLNDLDGAQKTRASLYEKE